jgi:hypothetical protein
MAEYKVTVFFRVKDLPTDCTQWCGDWYGNPIGPCKPGETAMLEKVPATHDVPGSEYFRFAIMRPSGTEIYPVHQGAPMKEHGVYVFDYTRKDHLVTQDPMQIEVLPPNAKGIKSRVIMAPIAVTNVPAGVDTWKVTAGTQVPGINTYTSSKVKVGKNVTVKAAMVCTLRFEAFLKDGKPYPGELAKYDYVTIRGGQLTTVRLA